MISKIRIMIEEDGVWKEIGEETFRSQIAANKCVLQLQNVLDLEARLDQKAESLRVKQEEEYLAVCRVCVKKIVEHSRAELRDCSRATLNSVSERNYLFQHSKTQQSLDK